MRVLVEPRARPRFGADDHAGSDVEVVHVFLDGLKGLLGEDLLRLREAAAAHIGDRDLRTRTRAEPPADTGGERGQQQDEGHQPAALDRAALGRGAQARGVVGVADRRRRRGHRGGQHLGEVARIALDLFADDAGREGAGDLGSDAELALDVAQAVEHDRRVGGPVIRRLLGRPQDELVELLGNTRVLDAGPGHRVGGVLEGDLHRLLALVRLLADEHLVQHDAERVDVAARVGHSACDQLGSEVGDRAEQLRAGGGVGRRGTREPEVADLDAAVLGEQHVLGLDVAVHDAGPVRGGEPGEDRVHDRHRLRHREAALLAQEFAQSDARQVLHDQVGHVAVLTLIEDVDHVRVGEPRGGPRFLDEPALEHGVIAQVAVHHLEGDPALEPQVGGHVHGRHAAARDARAHPVSAVDQTSDQRVGLLTRAHDPSLRTGSCEPAERLTPACGADRRRRECFRGVTRGQRATHTRAAPTARTGRDTPRSAPLARHRRTTCPATRRCREDRG